MTLTQKYEQSKLEKRCLRFATKHPDGDNYDGVVVQITPSFIALMEERDFEFDGVIVLPRKRIKGFRDNKYDDCRRQILQQNGAMKKLRVPSWLDSCRSLPQVLKELMRRKIWPGVETIFDSDGKVDSAFFLGPLTEVTDDAFFLKAYDAAGKWEKVYTLKYDEIFRVEFNSKYCRYFNAYMKSNAAE